tara:strand:- start:1345 stop:1992 length:648 start_codon:yes stop_codon:yes gene_type:complete
MALSKVNYNSMNVTPAASKAIKFNSSNNGLETGDIGGSLILISTQTADGSAGTLTFASNIDSTYKEYIFECINIHPQTNNANFQINFRDGSSSYDATKTTTYIKTRHSEDNSSVESVGYDDGNDVVQGTGVQILIENPGNDNDQCLSGRVHLFDPSNTTLVKHFITDFSSSSGDDNSDHIQVAGYCNVTAAIDGVQFSFASGNIDSGTIKMYGVL